MGDGMLSLSWNNHKATFCHILSTLREKERYTDVTLACEGKFYPVHKLVLSTCSEYFENMFDHTPCKHPIIVLKDVKPDELEALLSYMYAGVVNVAQHDLGRLIKAAELLQIKGLAVPDEPPQEAENKKTHAPPWSSRDDRSSPHPKRRKKGDENGTSIGSSQPSASPASSPRVSPFHAESDLHHDTLRSHSTNLDTRPEQRHDTRVEHNAENRLEPAPSSATGSSVQVMVDETLVKEEIVDTVDDSRSDGLDSGMDYGALGADSRVTGSNDGIGTDHASQLLPNKFDQPMVPTQQHLSESSVDEALAGPSGMQGWLTGGDLSGGFSSMDGYGGDGTRQDLRPPLPAQQPQGHQLGVLASLGKKTRGRRPGAYGNYVKKERSGTNMKKWSCNVKKFECTYCSYFTVTSTNLLNHMRTHTGEKPYACAHCPYRSTQKGNLRTHINKHHQSAYQDSNLGIEARRSVRKSVVAAATTAAVYIPTIPFPNTIPQPLSENLFKVQTNNDNRNLSVVHPAAKSGGDRSAQSGKETPRIRVKVFDCDGDFGFTQPIITKGTRASRQSNFCYKRQSGEDDKGEIQIKNTIGERILTSADSLICQVGNPVNTEGEFSQDRDSSNLPQITSVRSEAKTAQVNSATVLSKVTDSSNKQGDKPASSDDEVPIKENENPSYMESPEAGKDKEGKGSDKKMPVESEKESDISDPVSSFAQRMSKHGLKVKKLTDECKLSTKPLGQSESVKDPQQLDDGTKNSNEEKGSDSVVTSTSQCKT